MWTCRCSRVLSIGPIVPTRAIAAITAFLWEASAPTMPCGPMRMPIAPWRRSRIIWHSIQTASTPLRLKPNSCVFYSRASSRPDSSRAARKHIPGYFRRWRADWPRVEDLLEIPVAVLIAAGRAAAAQAAALAVCGRDPIPAGVIVASIFAGGRELAVVAVLLAAPVVTLSDAPFQPAIISGLGVISGRAIHVMGQAIACNRAQT